MGKTIIIIIYTSLETELFHLFGASPMAARNAKQLFQEVLKLSVFDLMEQALQRTAAATLEMRKKHNR